MLNLADEVGQGGVRLRAQAGRMEGFGRVLGPPLLSYCAIIAGVVVRSPSYRRGYSGCDAHYGIRLDLDMAQIPAKAALDLLDFYTEAGVDALLGEEPDINKIQIGISTPRMVMYSTSLCIM